MGKNKLAIPAPVLPIKLLAMFLDGFTWFPISKDQLTMLLEGNTCKSNDAFKTFNFKPISFSEKIFDHDLKFWIEHFLCYFLVRIWVRQYVTCENVDLFG